MNYTKLEATMRATYDATAPQYRRDDETDVLGKDHCRICQKLNSITCSFKRPLTVLDVGCGTGRYFYCLRNVEKLIGMDVSEQMLAAARQPVKAMELSAKDIQLVCGNVYTKSFFANSFDLIYSIGVFGNGCAVTPALCLKLFGWLKPGGYLLFDVFDSANLSVHARLKIKAKRFIYSLVPKDLRDAWDERTGWLPFFIASKTEIERLLAKSGFDGLDVESHAAQLTLGAGRKLLCQAMKPA